MRAASPNALFFVEPDVTSVVGQVTGLTRRSGDGIVFAGHAYPVGTSTGVPPAMLKWANFAGAGGWNVPAFIGEFGKAHDDNGAEYVTAEFDAIDRLRMNGAQSEYSVTAPIPNTRPFTL